MTKFWILAAAATSLGSCDDRPVVTGNLVQPIQKAAIAEQQFASSDNPSLLIESGIPKAAQPIIERIYDINADCSNGKLTHCDDREKLADVLTTRYNVCHGRITDSSQSEHSYHKCDIISLQIVPDEVHDDALFAMSRSPDIHIEGGVPKMVEVVAEYNRDNMDRCRSDSENCRVIAHNLEYLYEFRNVCWGRVTDKNMSEYSYHICDSDSLVPAGSERNPAKHLRSPASSAATP